MKKVLKVINEMVKDGVIYDYAIGGGIGAMFYTEPFLTYDIDIFVLLKEIKSNIILLTPIYEYLKREGYKWKGEHIVIEGIPVQFIPADELEQEAIKNAREISYEGIKTKIIAPEYLIAIFIRAGRDKDIEKTRKILKETKINKKLLNNILKKYGLIKKFNLLIKK